MLSENLDQVISIGATATLLVPFDASFPDTFPVVTKHWNVFSAERVKAQEGSRSKHHYIATHEKQPLCFWNFDDTTATITSVMQIWYHHREIGSEAPCDELLLSS